MNEQVAKHWHRSRSGIISCDLCPHGCKLDEGHTGLCRARKVQQGCLISLAYGFPSALAVDPIEKKPLYHFLPGSSIFSIGTYGCNMDCTFCQNWDISHPASPPSKKSFWSPQALVQAAVDLACPSIALTYNDPIISFEYSLDIMEAASRQNLKKVIVTAGYINKDPRTELFAQADAVNIDLKSINPEFYRTLTKGRLKPIQDTIRYLKTLPCLWMELTTLIIPEANDSEEDIKNLCKWIAEHLGSDVPIHFTAFHPAGQLTNRPRTPLATLERCYHIAQDYGLKYPYIGNVCHSEGMTTRCPQCRTPLITRHTHNAEQKITAEGRCQQCQERIPGVF